MPMRVAIVSPEAEIWTGEADRLVARTLEGEIGVLPRHAPMLGVLVNDGEVRLRTGGGDVIAKVDGGFISVTAEGVSILAEQAEIITGA
ncbi:MAG: F0F1 ATP synthase subunit epsilon [Frankia sp.]